MTISYFLLMNISFLDHLSPAISNARLKKLNHSSTTKIAFGSLLFYVVISPWHLPNQCPRKVIMILMENIFMFGRVHSNPCVLKTSRPKTVFLQYYTSVLEYEWDTLWHKIWQRCKSDHSRWHTTTLLMWCVNNHEHFHFSAKF